MFREQGPQSSPGFDGGPDGVIGRQRRIVVEIKCVEEIPVGTVRLARCCGLKP